VPLRDHCSRRRARLLVALGDDADDVAIAHDRDHPGHRSRGRVVERAELRAAHRGTDHRAARHAREADVCDERGSAGDDVARFQVRHGPARVFSAFLRHERDAVRDGAGERLRIEQLRVGHPLAAAYDGARFRVELFRGNAKLRARATQELMPRERRGVAQERRFLRDRVAPERPEVERHLVGVSEHDVYPLDRDIELVGDDLRESGPDTLAEIDLSRERGDAAVLLHPDPLLEPLGVVPVPHQDVPATRCTARIARPYTPQRQRLPASASRIDVSSGFGSRPRSAAAEITMPLVQYPHCNASSLTNASCTGCRVAPFPRPSIVVISMRAA